MRRIRRARAVVLAVVLTIAACSSSSPKASPSTTSASAPEASTSASQPESSPSSQGSDDLAARLIVDVPTGFVVQADSVGDTGPSDLAKAARDDGTPGASDALQGEGFVQGYQRLWVGPAQAEIIVFLYQFASTSGAEQDFAREKPQLSSNAPPGSTAFTVDGLPADDSVAMQGSSSSLSAGVVLFTKGVFNVQVVCNAPKGTDLQAQVSALAKDQFARL